MWHKTIPVLVVVLPDEALAHARLPVAAVVRHGHGSLQELVVLGRFVGRDQGLQRKIKSGNIFLVWNEILISKAFK